MLRLAAAFAIALCACTAAVSARAAEFIDDRGIAVRLARPATRIVSLSPHLAEVVFAAGAGDKLVGVTLYSDYPEAVRQLPLVGDASRIDVERVLLLRADLVLAWKSGNPAGDVRRLEQLGVPVFVTESARLTDIARLIRTVGLLAATASAAERAAGAFETEIAALRASFGTRRALRVFYEVWHRPLMTVNGRHLISDVIRLCGGVNVFAESPVLTPTVSLEAVLAARPDAIAGGSSAIDPESFRAQWRSYAIPALQQVGVVYVAPDEIQRASPRIAAGARTLCEGLERYRTWPR